MARHQEKLKQVLIGKKTKALIFAIIFLTISTYLLKGSFLSKEPFLNIPIYFSQTGIPFTEVTIEGKKYPFELDLGGDFYFSIRSEVMRLIKDTKPNGSLKSCDIKGNIYESPITSIERIEIKKITINNVPVLQEHLDCILEGSILKLPILENMKNDRLQILGRIGNRFFKGIDFWLIDFPNSSLIAIRNMENEKKEPRFHRKQFTEATLLQTSPLILIEVDTELGIKQFALDTGANRSILRTPLEFRDGNHKIYTTDHFKIGGHDFGSVPLYLFDMTPSFQCDGLIGRDFFKNHSIYLDFKSHKALISY